MEPLQEGKRPVIDFSKITPRKDVFRAGGGDDMIKIPGHVLAKIGREFRSNIENHIKDYILQKGDDVEWLLEPLDELSHSDDYVLDAFQVSTPWESIYKLYFHLKDTASIYIPFDKPIQESIGIRSEGNTIYFDDIREDDIPTPNPFDKSMIIKGDLKPLEASAIPSIWDDLVVPFTTRGIWQAVLLNETKAMFPKGWHADYLRKTYVFSYDDMSEIYQQHKGIFHDVDKEKAISWLNRINKEYDSKFTYFDHAKLAYYQDRYEIMPSVKIDGYKAIVTFHYWNDWSGFCKMIIPVEKHGASVRIAKYNHETLVEYESRIMY